MYFLFLLDVCLAFAEKKKKYSGGGMKYTAMAMANRAS